MNSFHDQGDGEDGPPTLSYSYPTSKTRPFWKNERLQTLIAVAVVLLVGTTLFGGTNKGRTSIQSAKTRLSSLLGSSTPATSSQDVSSPLPQPLKHLLIPANHPSPHLCKLVLTAATLAYPNPHLLTWQDAYNKTDRLGGGSHLAKISSTLEYLDRLSPSNDEDLVILVDGYDTWFQLPPEVLVNRYHDILANSDNRLRSHYGAMATRGVDSKNLREALSSKIVFAAAKRCGPNQPHTIACYPMPVSPLPADLYGRNTDTPIGRSEYSSYRQRYLSSGYIMGPAAAMRKLFRRADAMSVGREKLWTTGSQGPFEPTDNGSGDSKFMYYGSDQALFAKIAGRQEYVREVVRRRLDHNARWRKDAYMTNKIESTAISDVLCPDFIHEAWGDDKNWVPQERWVEEVDHPDPWEMPLKELLETYDFGIVLDYHSSLGHQTLDSEQDATWLRHDSDTSLEEQILRQAPRGPFDCPWHSGKSSSSGLSDDILGVRHPSETSPSFSNVRLPLGSFPDPDADPGSPNPWLTSSLYTHLCLHTTPVIIQHSGDESTRNLSWSQMSWLYDPAKPLLQGASIYEENGFGSPEEANDAGNSDGREGLDVGMGTQAPGLGGAWTAKAGAVSWAALCPAALIREGNVFGPSVAG